MRAPLSIIVPTLNAADELPDMLASLMPGLEAGVIRELIIVDGGSLDASTQIAADAGAKVITSAPGRGGQLNAGAKAASGAWLLFLHADTHLGSNWPQVVQAHIAGSDRAGYFRLRFRATGLAPTLVAGWANLRSRLGLPYGDQGLLVSRKMYADVRGYPDIALMEDVAMARTLRGKLDMLGAEASTGAARYTRDGWVRRGARNLSTLIRYLAGVDPDSLVDRYNR